MTKFAYIHPQHCIGCTKCLDVCPTDAIVGANKFLHSIITEDCIGCARCIPICPVDCIEMLPLPQERTHEERLACKTHFRFLAERRVKRLDRKMGEQKAFFLNMKAKLKGLS